MQVSYQPHEASLKNSVSTLRVRHALDAKDIAYQSHSVLYRSGTLQIADKRRREEVPVDDVLTVMQYVSSDTK